MTTKARQLAEFIANADVDSDEIATGAVSASKLAATLDLSSKTIVLPDLNQGVTITSPSDAEGLKLNGRSADDIGQLKFYENDGTTSLARLDARTTHFEVGSYNELRISAGGVGNNHLIVDASGRVKIGTTSNTPASADEPGFVFGDNTAGTPTAGVASFVANGAAPLLLTRRVSDGNVLGIADDTTTRGLLRVDGGDLNVSSNANLRLSAGGSSAKMTILSGGRVGIKNTGTDISGTSLDDVVIGAGTTVAGIVLDGGASSDTAYGFANAGTKVGRIQYINSSNSMVFQTNNANQMAIDDSGNVGIGTTSPQTPLHIQTNTAGITAELRLKNLQNNRESRLSFYDENNINQMHLQYDNGGNRSILTTNGNGLTIYSNQTSSEIVRFGLPGGSNYNDVDFKGKVGIGTQTPEEKIHVYGSGQQFIKVETTTTGSAAFVGMRMEDGDGDLGSIGDFGSGRRAFMLDTGSGVDMMFFTNNQNNSSADPRLTITTSGKLLVNSANPQDFKESLVMVGQGAYIGGVYLGKVSNSTNNTSAAILMHKLGQGQGFQFSGKFIINSWTGNKNIDCHATAYYTNDSVSVNTNHVNTGNVASATVRFCTVSYDGYNWLAFVKDGGGSGVAYLNAFCEGNIHFNGGIREITSGYSITTTHTTF